jgi:hypothetical protein
MAKKKSDKVDYKGLSEALQSDVDKLTEKLVVAQKELLERGALIRTYTGVLRACHNHFEHCITLTGAVTQEDIDYSRKMANRIIEHAEAEEKSK